MHRCRLLLEPRQLPLEIVHEQVRQVVAETSPHDDTQRGEVGPVLGKRVRGNLPAALAHGVRDVEHGEVLDAVGEREREDRELVASGQKL